MAKEVYLAPIEVDFEYHKRFHLSLEGVIPYRIGNRKTYVRLYPVTKEVYEAIMEPIWAEEKRMQRHHKCILTMPDGTIRRCDGNCEKCKLESYERRERNEVEPTGRDFFSGTSRTTLSLNAFLEDEDYEPIFENDKSGIILTVALFEQNLDRLKRYHPEYVVIFEKLFNEESEREIARELGISYSTLQYRIKKMREFLQQFVSREDIIGY